MGYISEVRYHVILKSFYSYIQLFGFPTPRITYDQNQFGQSNINCTCKKRILFKIIMDCYLQDFFEIFTNRNKQENSI